LLATTTVGRYQRLPTTSLSTGIAIERPYTQLPRRGAVGVDLKPDLKTFVDVTLGTSSAFDGGTVISPNWITDSRLGSFALKTFGRFAFDEGSQLMMPGGTDFEIEAGSIAMDGAFVSPSGTFRLRSIGPVIGNAPISIGKSALVNVAGTWVNDSPALATLALAPVWINGG